MTSLLVLLMLHQWTGCKSHPISLQSICAQGLTRQCQMEPPSRSSAHMGVWRVGIWWFSWTMAVWAMAWTLTWHFVKCRPVSTPSALSISRGHFSPNNSRKTAISRPLGQDMATFHDFEIWPMFCLQIYCHVCDIVLYCTTIYRESVVFIFHVWLIYFSKQGCDFHIKVM